MLTYTTEDLLKNKDLNFDTDYTPRYGEENPFVVRRKVIFNTLSESEQNPYVVGYIDDLPACCYVHWSEWYNAIMQEGNAVAHFTGPFLMMIMRGGEKPDIVVWECEIWYEGQRYECDDYFKQLSNRMNNKLESLLEELLNNQIARNKESQNYPATTTPPEWYNKESWRN